MNPQDNILSRNEFTIINPKSPDYRLDIVEIATFDNISSPSFNAEREYPYEIKIKWKSSTMWLSSVGFNDKNTMVDKFLSIKKMITGIIDKQVDDDTKDEAAKEADELFNLFPVKEATKMSYKVVKNKERIGILFSDEYVKSKISEIVPGLRDITAEIQEIPDGSTWHKCAEGHMGFRDYDVDFYANQNNPEVGRIVVSFNGNKVVAFDEFSQDKLVSVVDILSPNGENAEKVISDAMFSDKVEIINEDVEVEKKASLNKVAFSEIPQGQWMVDLINATKVQAKYKDKEDIIITSKLVDTATGLIIPAGTVGKVATFDPTAGYIIEAQEERFGRFLCTEDHMMRYYQPDKEWVKAKINKKSTAWLDGAKYVKHDPETDLTYAWFGGHMIHVYSQDGREVDVFNVGSFAENNATIEEVEEGIRDTMKELEKFEESQKGQNKVSNKMSDDAQSWISNKIKLLVEEGKSQDQAIAQAYSMARKKGYDVPEKKSSVNKVSDEINSLNKKIDEAIEDVAKNCNGLILKIYVDEDNKTFDIDVKNNGNNLNFTEENEKVFNAVLDKAIDIVEKHLKPFKLNAKHIGMGVDKIADIDSEATYTLHIETKKEPTNADMIGFERGNEWDYDLITGPTNFYSIWIDIDGDELKEKIEWILQGDYFKEENIVNVFLVNNVTDEEWNDLNEISDVVGIAEHGSTENSEINRDAKVSLSEIRGGVFYKWLKSLTPNEIDAILKQSVGVRDLKKRPEWVEETKSVEAPVDPEISKRIEILAEYDSQIKSLDLAGNKLKEDAEKQVQEMKKSKGYSDIVMKKQQITDEITETFRSQVSDTGTIVVKITNDLNNIAYRKYVPELGKQPEITLDMKQIEDALKGKCDEAIVILGRTISALKGVQTKLEMAKIEKAGPKEDIVQYPRVNSYLKNAGIFDWIKSAFSKIWGWISGAQAKADEISDLTQQLMALES